MLKAGAGRIAQIEGRVQMKTRRQAGAGGWGMLGGVACMREGVEKILLQGLYQMSPLPERSFRPLVVLWLAK